MEPENIKINKTADMKKYLHDYKILHHDDQKEYNKKYYAEKMKNEEKYIKIVDCPYCHKTFQKRSEKTHLKRCQIYKFVLEHDIKI
jgi:hypothetical protein